MRTIRYLFQKFFVYCGTQMFITIFIGRSIGHYSKSDGYVKVKDTGLFDNIPS